MKIRKTKYSKRVIQKAVKTADSFYDVLRSLGLSLSGGNNSYIRAVIELYGISIEHFTRMKSRTGSYSPVKKLPEQYLIVNKEYSSAGSHRIKLWMFRDGIKEKICEKCGKRKWMGKPIPLELHHINGNHLDNRLENLMILCPNCHALFN